MISRKNINSLKTKYNKKSLKDLLAYLTRRGAKSINSYVPPSNFNLSIKNIDSINLINKIEDISFKCIIDTETSKSGLINYIIFDGFYKDQNPGYGVIYVLINDSITTNDFVRLMIKFENLKKSYLYYQIHKTTQDSIKSAKSQYKDKNFIEENRVDKSQWQSHFNRILERAISLESSDIHITAKGQTATVKARVHGDLVEIDRYTYSDMLRLISSAYNQLASIDSKDQSYSPSLTHETGIHKIINAQAYNLRFISKPIYPSGSFDVTMRLINENFYKPLDQLGYSQKQLNVFQQVIGKPNGLIVLSGRVGSGKSLTIYSMCSDYIRRATQNNVITKKLVTFESPVEYKIHGAKQVEYKRDSSRTEEQERLYFESQVQSLLRMDTNACVLGEIRGRNVANLAIQLVQSDNIVLTTVHAQSALKIFNRLNNLGMDKEILAEPNFFLALVYQTLVKVPCKNCYKNIDTEEYKALRESIQIILRRYHLEDSLLKNIRIINSQGCDKCSFGVAGRTLIAEIFEPEDKILANLKVGKFNQAYSLWREQGGITYQEHGLMKILKGQICPVAYEDKVQSLVDEGFYSKIDQQYYPKVFANIDWECSNAI